MPGRRDEIAIEPEFVTTLLRHDFKLNVRELDRLLEQSFIISEGNTLQPPPELMTEIAPPAKAGTARAKAEAELAEHGGNANAAALALGISRWRSAGDSNVTDGRAHATK